MEPNSEDETPSLDKAAIVCVLDLTSGALLMMRRAPEDGEPHHLPRHDYSFLSETYEPEQDDGSLCHCAKRGLQEELGLIVDEEDLDLLAMDTNDDGTLCGYYACPIRDHSVIEPSHQIAEVAEHQWVRTGEFLSFIERSPYREQSKEFLEELTAYFNNFLNYL